jgi:hypothetical protein
VKKNKKSSLKNYLNGNFKPANSKLTDEELKKLGKKDFPYLNGGCSDEQ